jgi:hypothetical protein
MSGHTLPSWLTTNGQVLLKKHVRSSKYDSICEEVELIDITPTYAKVRMDSGREVTVSLRDLAPLPKETAIRGNKSSTADHTPEVEDAGINENLSDTTVPTTFIDKQSFSKNVFSGNNQNVSNTNTEATERSVVVEHDESATGLRRSARTSVPPDITNYSKLGGTNNCIWW